MKFQVSTSSGKRPIVFPEPEITCLIEKITPNHRVNFLCLIHDQLLCILFICRQICSKFSFQSALKKILPSFVVMFQCWTSVGRLMLVGQCPVKSLSSVYPSVCPLLSFLKIGSLVILILYMMIVAMISSDWRSQIFGEKKMAARIGTKWAKIVPKTRFFAIFQVQFISIF